MPQLRASDVRSHIFFMLLAAGIFAYFGFGMSWSHQYTNANAPQPNTLLPMVVVLKWTLRGGAIAFSVSAVLAMGGMTVALWLYAMAGLTTAVLFAIVGVWEVTNAQGYFSGVPAILLFIFAAWNGYSSLSGLMELLASRDPSGVRAARNADSVV